MLGIFWRSLTASVKKLDMKDIDLQGKNVIVTGSNTGIGFSTAKIFANLNSNVFMACRTKSKAEEAIKEILSENEAAKVKFIELDLGKLSSIDRFVSLIDFQVDILVNNAGVVCKPEIENEDGFEVMFSVNTLGTYYLSKKMIPKMKRGGRIVIVSAGSHHLVSKSHFENLKNIEDLFAPPIPLPWFYSGRLSSFYQYSVTKTFMLMLAIKLHQEYNEKTGISINSLHPGIIKTEFGKTRDENQKKVNRKKMIEETSFMRLNWTQGAQTTVFVALSKELENVSGLYFENCGLMDTSSLIKDKKYQDFIYEKVEEILEKHEKESNEEEREEVEEVEGEQLDEKNEDL